ncbi:MAG: hypothetical protein ACXVEE_26265 [Polyangiales bacterium]
MRIPFLSALLVLSWCTVAGCSGDDETLGGDTTDAGDETLADSTAVDSETTDSETTDSADTGSGDSTASDSSASDSSSSDSTSTDSTDADASGDGPIDVAVDVALPAKRVFITSATYDGALGGVAGANANCQSLAGAAGLSGTFKAWISDSTSSPSTSFVHYAGDYALKDGTVIAHGWSDLTDGTLLHGIDQTETGGSPPSGSPVCGDSTKLIAAYTGTSADGTSNGWNCNGWTSIDMSYGASWGSPTETTNLWSTSCTSVTAACGKSASLYCFEQ